MEIEVVRKPPLFSARILLIAESYEAVLKYIMFGQVLLNECLSQDQLGRLKLLENIFLYSIFKNGIDMDEASALFY